MLTELSTQAFLRIRKPHTLVGLVSCFAAAIAAYLVAAPSFTHTVSTTKWPWQSVQPAPIGKDPFAFGKSASVTMSAAKSAAGFPIFAPSTSAANASSVSNVWLGTTSVNGKDVPEVVLDYVATGIRVTLEPAGGVSNEDWSHDYAVLASQLALPENAVTTANGVPALEQAPGDGQTGFVDLHLSGVHIAVIGSQDLSTLEAIAESLHQQ